MGCTNRVAFTLIALLGACQTGPPAEGIRTDTPEALLRAILDRSREHDYEGIRELVYPLRKPIGTHLTAQDRVVELMKRQDARGRWRDGVVYTGDFSYSDAALEQVLDSHMHLFRPPPDRWLRPMTDGGLLDEELLRRTSGDPNRFRFFDYVDCRILLVELDGQYRLVFWEGMNHLLVEPVGLARDVVVVDRVVSEDGGVFQSLEPLMAVSESVDGLRVDNVSNRPRHFRVSVPEDVMDAYLVHVADETMWGKLALPGRGSDPGTRQVVMVKQPLATILATMPDGKLRQFLNGVLSLGGQEDALEAILAEIGRRGGKPWLRDLHRVLNKSHRELAALAVARQIEGGVSPLKIGVEIAPIGETPWLDLRITNQDETRNFTLPGSSLCTHLVRLRNADGAVVFDNALAASEPDPDLNGGHTLHSLAPGESMVLHVRPLTDRLPRGSYIAEWIYHRDRMVLRWNRNEDRVVFRGTCEVKVD